MTEQNLPAASATTTFKEVATRPSIFFDMERFADAQRVATMLASSNLVPAHFQGKVANCVIALNLADRLMVDPFMLMQSMYIVHGKPGIEGKLAIALIEGTRRFSPLKFRFSGQGKTEKGIDRSASCIAYATEIATGQEIEGPPVTWEMAVAEGWTKPKGTEMSKWQTMPDLMFRYRSAMFFARTNCPSALLGLRSSDEIEDIEMMPSANGTYKLNPSETYDESGNLAPATDFAVTIPEGTDTESLEDFISRTAEAQKVTPDAVKSAAARDGAGFWKAFSAWTRQEAKRKERQASQNQSAPNPSPLAPGPCPDAPDVTYTAEHCDTKCPSRQGCPAWEEVPANA